MPTQERGKDPVTGDPIPLPGPLDAIPAGMGLSDAQAMWSHAVTALEDAGRVMGVVDRQVVAWVAGQRSVTIAVVASLVYGALHTPVPDGGGDQPGPVIRGGLRHEPDRRVVRGLLVPADLVRECVRVDLSLSAVAISDCIGGGLLDEVFYGEVFHGQRFCVYADLDRVARDMVPNLRAEELVDRLSGSDRSEGLDLRGDVLFLGATAVDDDADLPGAAWAIAHVCGLWPVRGRDQ
jgi:hypothetical protein